MGSISRHITPLVINSLGAGTHTHTHTHTDIRGQSNSKEPGVPGFGAMRYTASTAYDLPVIFSCTVCEMSFNEKTFLA